MASGNFDNCLPIILHFEGGKSNDPRDPGGRTNKGITQRTYDAYRAAKGLPGADVYRIASTEVADCYRRNYWDAVKGDALRPGEDLVVFDFSVNSGPARALRAWNAAGGATIGDAAIVQRVCANRLAFMHSLSTWPHFGAGWATRVGDVEKYGLAMATGRAPTPKRRVKPPHAGGAVVVAGGAVAAFIQWFSGHPIATAAVIIAFGALGVYLWSKLARIQKMAATPAQAPHPDAPHQDAVEAAIVKVSAAKGALAVAIADALRERDALVARGAALKAAVAAAEARLAAMGVDLAHQPPAAVDPTSQASGDRAL